MNTKENGIHQGWFVFAGSILIVFFGMGLMMNVRGVLFSAIIADLGFRSGDLAIYYTICSLCSSLSITFTSKLYNEKNPKIVMLVLEGLVCLTTGLMGTFSHLWQWYIAGIFNGIGAGCIMLCIGITINNWFRKYNGTLVGVAMAGSGVAGTIFNPIFARMINNMGWRKSIMILAALGMAVTAFAVIFLLESTPERVGKRPYGEKEAMEKTRSENLAEKDYTTPGWLFPFTVTAFILFMAVSPVNNQLATYARGLGFSLTVGATITSCSMIGNVLGKLALGSLADKLGIYRAVNIIQVLVLTSLILFFFGKSNQYILYVAAFMYGTIFSVSTTMPPLLFADIYGPKNYRAKVSKNRMYYGLSVAALSSALPYIYDFTGTYDTVFIGGAIASFASLIMFNVVRKFSEDRAKKQA